MARESDFDRVQKDQQTTAQTVGELIDAKATATRQRSAAAPGAVFLPGQ